MARIWKGTMIALLGNSWCQPAERDSPVGGPPSISIGGDADGVTLITRAEIVTYSKRVTAAMPRTISESISTTSVTAGGHEEALISSLLTGFIEVVIRSAI